MVKHSEETLNNWRKPPSNSEADKLTNAERMLKDCINEDDILQDMNIRKGTLTTYRHVCQ